jgi:hypothetical protein
MTQRYPLKENRRNPRHKPFSILESLESNKRNICKLPFTSTHSSSFKLVSEDGSLCRWKTKPGPQSLLIRGAIQEDR